MANLENNSIWPDVEERIVDLIESHRSSIVFANSRRLAERLTARLNEIHAERVGNRGRRDAQPEGRRRLSRPDDGQRRGHGRRATAGQGPPRIHQQGAARDRRGRPEDRPAEGRRRHVEPRTRHRHGGRRPRHPGRVPTLGGQRPAAHRQGGSPGRRDLSGRAAPEAPHRPHRLRRHGAAHARRRDRDHAGAHQPLGRAGSAHRGRGRPRTSRRRPLVRRRAPQRTVRHAAAQRVRGDAGSAERKVSLHRVRRAAPAVGVRPRRGVTHRAARRPAAGGDLRRRDSRPRPVHGVPGLVRRYRQALPRRRTRRGDGVRVAAGRRHLPGRHQLAHHRDHPRPGAGPPGAGAARPTAVLARRRRGQARRTRAPRSGRSPEPWPD